MKLSIPQDPAKKAVALSRYSETSEIPMVVVSLVFLGAYTWQVVADPAGTEHLVTELVMFLTWAVFLADFIITMALTEKRKRWSLMNLVNFAVVVLPVFRTLRLLRVVSLLRVLNRATSLAFGQRIMSYVVSSSMLLTYTGALAVLDAERDADNANILNFGDALWWAFVTITTIGFGDRFPVTAEGRLIAVGLAVAGISLIGLVTVTMGTWVMATLQKIRTEELAEEESDDLQLELIKVRARGEELALELNRNIERESELEGILSGREASDVPSQP
ncbi:potassium channel family protein [Pseudarthrobacter sp. BIM B-2242]|uniref:potassium channel family protein n=1 Tax=Pseudarthrobacter sp. BIM B-2242 TaxID=2772401 RepID=UPI00168B3421|nr:potassium channel family protein [Pseudarthrobacter sp. BIM B-2242]QOD05845.1 two pore domain potassium channel family protein [Pseudarthrobacter sp. BIM B-2242]